MRRAAAIAALLFLISTAPVFAESAAGPSLTPLVFMPQWTPQAQFAGYYVAEQRGFYRARGVDVKIVHGGPSAPADRALAEGTADIVTLFLTTGVTKRSEGLDFVNICQTSQRSGLMFVAMKSSGIRKPEDLRGRSVGVWHSGFQSAPKAFLKKYGAENAEIVPISSGINLFLWGGVDVLTVMWYNEYHQLLSAGLAPDDMTAFFFSEQGFNVPEDGLYCKRAYYEKNPEACRAFVEASLEGWEFAFANPTEALALVMDRVKKAKLPANLAHQNWMLLRMKDLMAPDGGGRLTGVLTEDAFNRTVSLLMADRQIQSAPIYREFFKRVTNGDKK